jgi:hypothetical protein
MDNPSSGTGASPSPQQVHPIHTENQILDQLTQFVRDTPENDPHSGTDLEATKPTAPETTEATPQAEAAPEEPQSTEETIEFDEETPIFDVELKTETGKETKKLSLKEMRDGYQRMQDYHRSIQKVKAQENELTAKEQKAVLAAQAEYVQRLEVHKQAVSKLAGVKSLQEIEELSRTDPAGAQQEFLRMISVNQTLQGIESEQRQATENLQASQQEAKQAAIMKTREILENDIPGWGEEMYRKVISTVTKDYGFESKDVEQVYDSRLIKVLHDAYQYRQLKNKPSLASKKVVGLPKVLLPGSAEKSNPASEASQELQKKVAKTGDWRDAANLYLARSRKK